MVVKRRLLLAVASALTLVLAAAGPMMGATKEAAPRPLREETLLRVKDMAANGATSKGAIVAVGWHEGSGSSQLNLAFSINGGKNYSRTNGNLRKYPIVGNPSLGMSVDICANRVWVGSGYSGGSDKAGDSDVFLTSRTIGGGAAQALLTNTADDRRVRDVSVACVGNDLIAVAWVEKFKGRNRARMMLRSLEPLGTAPRFKRTYNLGDAELKSGLAVAGTPDLVAVAYVRNGILRLKRFEIGEGVPPAVKHQAAVRIAWKDLKDPVMAARGNRLVVAYSDAGKVKAKVSKDKGKTLSGPKVLVRTGGLKNRSKPYSADVVGDRIVFEVGAYSKTAGKVTPERIQSLDGGDSWSTRSYGHRGTRVGALLKKKGRAPLLMEAWHNNAPKGSRDTLRARYELP